MMYFNHNYSCRELLSTLTKPVNSEDDETSIPLVKNEILMHQVFTCVLLNLHKTYKYISDVFPSNVHHLWIHGILLIASRLLAIINNMVDNKYIRTVRLILFFCIIWIVSLILVSVVLNKRSFFAIPNVGNKLNIEYRYPEMLLFFLWKKRI